MDTGMSSLQKLLEEVVNTEGRHNINGLLSKKVLTTLQLPDPSVSTPMTKGGDDDGIATTSRFF